MFGLRFACTKHVWARPEYIHRAAPRCRIGRDRTRTNGEQHETPSTHRCEEPACKRVRVGTAGLAYMNPQQPQPQPSYSQQYNAGYNDAHMNAHGYAAQNGYGPAYQDGYNAAWKAEHRQ